MTNEGSAAGGQGEGSLEVVSGPDAGRVVALGSVTAIGRAHGTGLSLTDSEVSRSHAEVRFAEGGYRLVDLGSRNGVRLDDALVRDAALREGQRIGLGRTVIAFHERKVEVPFAARLALLEKSELLRGLAPEDRAAVAGEMAVRFYPKGALIQRQGQPVGSMLFVHQGQIRVASINEAGAEHLVARLTPGSCFGERNLLGGASGGHGLIADTDVWLLELSKQRLGGLLKQRPAADHTFHGNLASSLRAAQGKAEAAAQGAVEEDEHDVRRDELQQLVTSTEVEIVGADAKIQQAKRKLDAWAKEPGPLLVTGPAGSGKKTFARYFHRLGPQPRQPYIELALGDQDAARRTASIFGEDAEGGAAGSAGYLEMMGEGTLALLHAELLDAHQQIMLATYLERGWFQRAFGQSRVASKVRVVLVAYGSEDEVLAGFVPELREALGARKLAVPALSSRISDIPALAEHFLKRQAGKTGKRVTALTREAMDRLVSYGWPGNVRELKHVLKRASIVASAGVPIPVDFIFVVPPEKEALRVNLLRSEKLRAVLRHPALSQSLLWATTAFVLFVAAITLWGALQPLGHPLRSDVLNPGMWLTWHVWFAVLPLSALLFGRIWCAVCPIAFIGDLVAKVARLNLPVPKIVKRLDFWLLLAAFVVVDSTEGLTGVADSPLATFLFLVLIIGAAVFVTFVFERRVFCRYFCPLAGWLGTYSTVSMFEVRGNKRVCQTRCGDYTCYKGTERVPGCPMFLYPASMTTNAECMMCGNCIKSCENRGVQLNLRPPLQELWQNPKPTVALGLFALVISGVMLFHQFTKLPWWKALEAAYPLPPIIAELGGYALFVGFTAGGFVFASVLSAAAGREAVSSNLARFGLGFVPLALAAHLAFVTRKFLIKGLDVIVGYFMMLWGSLVRGVPMGTEPVTVPFQFAPSVVTFIKFEILALGILGSVIAIAKIARAGEKGVALGRALPHLLYLLVLSVLFMYAHMSVGS